jgi:hypothetical protein
MDAKTAEYTFLELVEDPLVGLLMKSDGVDRRSIELLFERVASSARYRETTPRPNC